ncbi:hypothetical protein PCCS19_18820 [Paenibacillus sp. CCS19]|uniref:hypothetical protein n=1 Tax=Paenibacillus sp. CCS19 TaxID=3158387 RepID=UPI0025625970|nr:hypothetical protein [Paenibacillus cellulosilyticus]GMK38828.1 hypothetical protein PCCS19_18820 [Paenibacillus cellulosilyticus]
MFWPTPQDYREAIQNPRICFKDPDLQAGLPELDKLGLPRPISGSFASVYRLKCGEREWAVRCFTTNVKDQKIRYDAISLHLRTNPLPYLVPFEYLSEGININGKWFPVVKMQWVEGESLLDYMGQNLHRADLLQELSDKWIIMTRELCSANIGHGDLQHGNILISNNEIILIDYDGMYVPALTGMPSNELGHRNYQHPGRNEEHFGPYIDHFSAWAVWISITAVSADPSLWHSLEAGELEECLLFRRNDFVSPDTSRAFELLALAQKEAVRTSASLLRAFATGEVPEVPSLSYPETEEKAAQPSSPHISAFSFNTVFRTTRTALAVLFDRLFKRKAKEVAAIPLPEASYSGGASWVLDHIALEATPHKQRSTYLFLAESIISYLIVLAAATTAAITYSSASVAALLICSIAGLGTELAFLRWRYDKAPSVQEKRAIYENVKRLELVLSELRSELNELNEMKRNFCRIQEGLIEDCVQRLEEAAYRERHATEAAEKELHIHLSGLARKRQNMDQAEKTELSRKLASFQKTWLEEKIIKHKISQEKIPEIDDEMKRRLRANGIRTPADFMDFSINQSYGRKQIDKAYLILKNGGSVHAGMSRAQARALVDWKRKIERSYRTKIPAVLPRSDISAIALKYKDRKSQLTDAEQTHKTLAEERLNKIKQDHHPELDSLTKEVEAARIRLEIELHHFDRQIEERGIRHSDTAEEYRDLNKRMAAYMDVHFASYVKQVFLFRR